MARSPWGPEARPNKARPKHGPSTMDLGPGPIGGLCLGLNLDTLGASRHGPIGPMGGTVGRHGPRPAPSVSLLYIDVRKYYI